MFIFTPDYITEPSPEYDIESWGFSQDLRQFFPNLESNTEIGDLLEKRKIVKSHELDCEYSCTWLNFKTKRAATAFLKRLNAMPEVKNYVPPPAPPSGHVMIVSVASWQTLKSFLQANMDAEKFAKLQDLELELWEMEI